MSKHVVLTIEMGVEDLPETATDFDYAQAVLKYIIEEKPTFEDMGHQCYVSDDDDVCWRTAPCPE